MLTMTTKATHSVPNEPKDNVLWNPCSRRVNLLQFLQKYALSTVLHSLECTLYVWIMYSDKLLVILGL